MCNTLWLSDAIWRQRAGSTPAKVMVWHQAITWTNVDLSLVRSNDIHLKAISQQDTSYINHQDYLESYLFKSYSNFPGVNDLSHSKSAIRMACDALCYNDVLIIHWNGTKWLMLSFQMVIFHVVFLSKCMENTFCDYISWSTIGNAKLVTLSLGPSDAYIRR